MVGRTGIVPGCNPVGRYRRWRFESFTIHQLRVNRDSSVRGDKFLRLGKQRSLPNTQIFDN